MDNYTFPKSFPRAEEIELYVNGQKVDVLKTDETFFACVSYSGKVVLEIKTVHKIEGISISPQRFGIQAHIKDCTASFELEGNFHLYIEMQGISRPLFFYGNAILESEEDNPNEATYYFKGGQTYEVGEIVLKDNESLFIEGGAIVKGAISAKNASKIKIYGQGVLDGSYFKNVDSEKRTILLDGCTNVVIKDIIIIQPVCWMIMLAGCQNVHIDNLKEIGEVVSSDGIDVVGSSDVVIENCILRNNDDCVVVKAFERSPSVDGDSCSWNKHSKNILIRKCTFVNGKSGNAMEIGHELQIEEVKNVKFYDIDVVCVHGYGAAFSIHVGDRAVVRDIVFENIRVEHYYDKLLDFRIMCSQFNKDRERGQLRYVLLKDIYVTVSRFNPGYSISVIGGYDEKHTVEDITFKNFYLGDKKVCNADQLELFTKNAKNIVFK